MKKLLAFVAVLSFSATEAGILGSIASSALQGIATYNNYPNGYGANGMNNYGTNYNMGSNGMAYNNGAMGMNNYGNLYNNGVNLANVSTILNNMYQQAVMIQNNYQSNSNIVNYTSNLGNALKTCQQNPSQTLNQLPTILQYIVGIYNVLNQYNAGVNARNLVNGFSQLLSASMGM